jgi:hypothetical protein
MKESNWFVHVEWVVVLITLLGGFYTLDSRIDMQATIAHERLLAQEARTDKLYEMFIDLVRSGCDKK